MGCNTATSIRSHMLPDRINAMSDKLLQLLVTLGDDGIQAYYTYLFLEYGMCAITVGLAVWGIRTAWPIIKKDL